MEVNSPLENKPFHYDGSAQINGNSENEFNFEAFEITDEIRKNISGNPYFMN